MKESKQRKIIEEGKPYRFLKNDKLRKCPQVEGFFHGGDGFESYIKGRLIEIKENGLGEPAYIIYNVEYNAIKRCDGISKIIPPNAPESTEN